MRSSFQKRHPIGLQVPVRGSRLSAIVPHDTRAARFSRMLDQLEMELAAFEATLRANFPIPTTSPIPSLP
jgi:hypothetical protein